MPAEYDPAEFFDYLLAGWREARGEEAGPEPAELSDFVDYSRRLLLANRPVSVALTATFSLQLQDGTIVHLVPPAPEDGLAQTAGIHITGQQHMLDRAKGMQSGFSWPVTDPSKVGGS